jgi:hypothetical protein
MKKYAILVLAVVSLLACKKQHISPEGPTDVRIRNLSSQVFQDVIVITSEKTGDTLSFGTISNSMVTEYSRFSKAYPKAEITANINLGGSLVKFTTGPVDYTYMQYIGRDRITYEVNIADMGTHSLVISNVIEEAPLSDK